jgi:amino acid transporter
MARDGVFARLARVSERFGTPASAIVLLAVWSALLAASERSSNSCLRASPGGFALGAMSVLIAAKAP